MTHLVTIVFVGEKWLYNLQGLKQQVSKYLYFPNGGLSFLNRQCVIGALQFLLSVKIQFLF